MGRERLLAFLLLCLAVIGVFLVSAPVQNVQANVADSTWAMQRPDLQRTGTGNYSSLTAPNLKWSSTDKSSADKSGDTSVIGDIVRRALAIVDWFFQQFTTVGSSASAQTSNCGMVQTLNENVTVNAAGNSFFSDLLGIAKGLAEAASSMFGK